MQRCCGGSGTRCRGKDIEGITAIQTEMWNRDFLPVIKCLFFSTKLGCRRRWTDGGRWESFYGQQEAQNEVVNAVQSPSHYPFVV